MELGHYSAMIFLTLLTCGVLSLLIAGNTRMERAKRLYFSATALLIAVCGVAEYFGVVLNGAPEAFRGLHIFLKTAELSVSPFLVILLVCAFNGFSRAKRLLPVALCNLVFEISTSFTGFLFYFDADNVYHHGSWYWLYTVVYILSGVFFYLECLRFSRYYQNRSGTSLLAILLLLIAGLSIHSAVSTVRADWLTLSTALCLFYIYYIGLVGQIDSLTQLLDRKSYDIALASLRKSAVIVFFDIDCFKAVNDLYGHEAGDACLRAVSDVLKDSYCRYGLCYRIGGDEFCAILTKPPLDLEAAHRVFYEELARARAARSDLVLPNVALGSARFFPKADDIMCVVRRADEEMYRAKKQHKLYTVQPNAANFEADADTAEG